jgi:hypothetical protein
MDKEYRDDMKYKRSYSLADIARKIDRPRTTVQAWRDQFKAYIPTVSGTKGRATRYEVEALTIFELISRMKDDNEPPEMIEHALKQNVNFIVVDEDDEQEELPMVAQMFDSFKQMAAVLEEQKRINDELTKELQEIRQQQVLGQQSITEGQQELQQKLLERIDKQQQYIDEKLTARDEKLMTTMRELQESKDQSTSFWKKLFK